jgi:hypothetical protein
MKDNKEYAIIDGIYYEQIGTFDNIQLITVYELEVDCYNQPTGIINNIKMTEALYNLTKLTQPTKYIYNDIIVANYRAQA